jgi:hypothetical protein
MGALKYLVVLAVAIGGMLASLILPWWHMEAGGATMDITLRSAELCRDGTCTSFKPGGMHGMLGVMTMAYGGLAVIWLVLKGVAPTLSGDKPKAGVVVSGMVYLMLVGLMYGTIEVPEQLQAYIKLELTWSFWAGVIGACAAIVAPMLGAFEPSPLEGKAVLYKPPVIKRDEGLAAHPPAAAAAVPAAPVAPPAPRPHMAPIDLDEPAGKPEPRPEIADAVSAFAPDLDLSSRAGSEAEHQVVDVPLLPPRPARVTASPSGGVRFALATAEVREDALLVQGEDGRGRQLAWNELGGALARELRGAPFPVDALLVDLVPRRGAPLRFLITTKLTFTAAGSGAVGPRDDLRRLLAFARAMHPGLEIEGATADFMTRREPLPTWTADDLERYDARYRAG